MKRLLGILAFLLLPACSAEPDASKTTMTTGTGAVEFANLRAEEIGSTRAVVRFATSRPTSCEAEYGVAEDAMDLRATDPEMPDGELVLVHEVPLEDLPAETEIFWRARAVDADGVVAVSDVHSFTTLAEADNGTPLQNFAAGTPAAQVSSNFGGGDNAGTWGADLAFDGQMSTEWATDGDGDDAMIAIDLGSVRKITHVAFRSRKMADGTSIIEQFQVRFDDGEAVGPFDSPNPDERYVFELANAQSAQIITFEALQTTGGNTGAKEIEFLGTPKE